MRKFGTTRACLTRGINLTRNTRYAGFIPSGRSITDDLQLYHSIHARGERVSDVLKAAKDSNTQENGKENTDLDSTSSRIPPPKAMKVQELDNESGGADLNWTRDTSKVGSIP